MISDYGAAYWVPRHFIQFPCVLDEEKMIANCSLKMGSWTHNGETVSTFEIYSISFCWYLLRITGAFFFIVVHTLKVIQIFFSSVYFLVKCHVQVKDVTIFKSHRMAGLQTLYLCQPNAINSHDLLYSNNISSSNTNQQRAACKIPLIHK